jgi:hypothetical protein
MRYMTETCLQHCCISDSVNTLAGICVDWESSTNTIVHSLMMAYKVVYLSNHDQRVIRVPRVEGLKLANICKRTYTVSDAICALKTWLLTLKGRDELRTF